MKSLKKILKTFLISIGLLAILIAVLYGHRDIPVNKLKEVYATSPSAFITVDSMDVHYRDEGNPSDSIPIVLIHGTGASLHTFNDWTSVLKKEHRVLRMDIPAFGLTGPFPNRDYSIEHYVEFLAHFLKAKKIKKCVLAGNSLGGRIAWNFTLKHPKMVHKLILIDASGYPSESKSIPIAFKVAGIPILNKLLTFITPRFMVTSSVKNVYADKTKITEKLVDRYYKMTLRAGNRQALVDRISAINNNKNTYLQINTIQQPTLVLWGAQDLLVPLSNAHRFHKDLPNSSLVILKNVGHVPMEESPTESLAAFTAFLKN